MTIDLNDNAEKALRMVREAKDISYDTESTGVDWRIHSPIGYVVGAPDGNRALQAGDVVYVPIRHGGGGNVLGGRPMTSPTEGFEPHPFEVELAKAFEDRRRTNTTGRVIGHNMKFDVHMSANAGVLLGRRLACTQNMAAMVDEYARRYSLEAVAEREGVTAKKGTAMYEHLASMFGGPAQRDQMSNFWRTAGTDPVVYDYATGDGVSTWEIYWKLLDKLHSEGMETVCNLENDLIWTVYRMERTGIAVDMERVDQLRSATEAKISRLLSEFPVGFNTRSPVHMRKAMEEAGHTDWPLTEKGAPSFTEKWLKKNPLGKKIIEIRQNSNLISSFINPLAERHVFKGRVHATLNQLKNDDKGTISGRFSCSDPNLQQVPKRIKEIAKPFRRLFVADEGWVFWERDFSQCFVAGTKVSTPKGPRNIEDMEPGDLVYSYNDDKRLVLRPVTWAGQTGVREVVRVHWKTNGRTKGHFDCTPDHRIRKTDGSYVTAGELFLQKNKNKKGNNPLWVPVLALRHAEVIDPRWGYKSVWIHPTGTKRMKEARFVFSEVNGWHPEEVHHIDGNSVNNDPNNLQGLTGEEHKKQHMPYGADRMTRTQWVERSRKATAALLSKMGKDGSVYGNHAIVDVEFLDGAVPVYDITVEDTHNFIANQVCVHNCEPRLFAHYSQDENLVKGYNSTPFRDAHTVVADMLGVERDPTAKRMNMGIFTGMQPKSFAGHMDWDMTRATKAFNAWMAAFPGVRGFQDKAKQRLARRGYVHTILGRRCRLEEPRFAYRGTSKIIQGSNADIVKLKLLEADRLCEDNGDIVRVLMTVHDSFNGQYQDTPEARALFEQMVHDMAEVQTPPFNLSVPFVLEGTEGKDWCEATFGPEKEAA